MHSGAPYTVHSGAQSTAHWSAALEWRAVAFTGFPVWPLQSGAPCHTVPHNAVPHRATPYSATPCHTVPVDQLIPPGLFLIPHKPVCSQNQCQSQSRSINQSQSWATWGKVQIHPLELGKSQKQNHREGHQGNRFHQYVNGTMVLVVPWCWWYHDADGTMVMAFVTQFSWWHQGAGGTRARGTAGGSWRFLAGITSPHHPPPPSTIHPQQPS